MTPTEQARLKPRTTRKAGVNENKGGSPTSTPPPKTDSTSKAGQHTQNHTHETQQKKSPRQGETPKAQERTWRHHAGRVTENAKYKGPVRFHSNGHQPAHSAASFPKTTNFPRTNEQRTNKNFCPQKKTSVCGTTQCQSARMQRSARLARVLSWINSRG